MTRESSRALKEYRRRMSMAMDYIARHLEESPDLDAVARAACFSKFHFHRIFRAMLGETVAEFTRRLRLEKAANRLTGNPDASITGIAHACGFSSSQNFARAFRKHFGATPTEYRDARLAEMRKIGHTEGKEGNDETWPPLYDPDLMDWNQADYERSGSMQVDVKNLPPRHVAYVRSVGPYGPESCGGAFGRLMAWAGPRGLVRGATLGISWDNPDVTPPEKCRYDACVEVPEGTPVEGEVATQVVPGGDYAMYRREVSGDEFGAAWQALMCEWLPASGYQPDDRPCFELCHPGSAEGRWIVDFCCPVKPL